jgi:hypothetical protein
MDYGNLERGVKSKLRTVSRVGVMRGGCHMSGTGARSSPVYGPRRLPRWAGRGSIR